MSASEYLTRMRAAKYASTSMYSGSRNSRRGGTSQDPSESRLVVNNAGAKQVYALDNMKRATRFLILGSQGGTYYQTQPELTAENASALVELISSPQWKELVDLIVDVSVKGRAAKQQPTMFALALACRLGDLDVRRYAFSKLSEVCRIPTHLFMFIGYMESFKGDGRGTGWGKLSRRAIAAWYNDKDVAKLARFVTKYQNREGWTHKDVLSLAHVKPIDDPHSSLYKYVVNGEIPADQVFTEYLSAVAIAKTEGVPEEDILGFISSFRLEREHLHTSYLSSVPIWTALLKNMGLTAMIRNLGKMTATGLFQPLSETEKQVVDALCDTESLKRQRVHPFSILVALHQYKKGCGARGSLSWSPNQRIVAALDKAFYASFGNVASTNKNILIGMDVSGSMGWGDINGVPGMTPLVAASAMVLLTLKTEEPNVHTYAFCDRFVPWGVNSSMDLDGVMSSCNGLSFGRTDCALPMIYAKDHKIPVDTFIIYTDCETWAGRVTPAQSLRDYRRAMNRPHAQLIVVAMTSSGFTIADPEDPGMLDVVGFDTSAPEVMRQFMAGEL